MKAEFSQRWERKPSGLWTPEGLFTPVRFLQGASGRRLGMIRTKAGVANMLGAGTPEGAAPPSYLLSESFEGAALCETSHTSNCTNTWAVVNGANSTRTYNYTTSPLEGTNSLQIVSTGSNYIWANTSSTSTSMYVYFMVKITANGADNNGALMGIEEANDGSVGLRVRNYVGGNTFLLYHGTIPAFSPNNAWQLNTTYHIWLQYTAGSGANGVGKLWVSTDGTFPGVGNETISIANGNSTYTLGAIYCQATETGWTHVYDKIRVSDNSADILKDNPN